jgi:hypothetical protein
MEHMYLTVASIFQQSTGGDFLQKRRQNIWFITVDKKKCHDMTKYGIQVTPKGATLGIA